MHVHIGGAQAVLILLIVIAGQGAINLLAMRLKDRSSLAASYANLFGLS